MPVAPLSVPRLSEAFGKIFLPLFLAVCCLLAGSQAVALAHGMYVFAWPEGGRICAEGYYSNKRKVQGGQTRAVNPEGAIVAQGTSDGQGRWCFTPPRAGEVTIIYADGQGHRAEFAIAAPENTGAEATSPAAAPAAPGKDAHAVPPGETQEVPAAPTPAPAETGAPPPDAGMPSPAFAVREDQLRSWIRAETQAQLVPLHKALAERDEPRLRDIVGGLGWIVGLVGMGAYFLQRRGRRKP